VSVPDPSGKTDANGYPILLGKRHEEARTVLHIFQWYADDSGSAESSSA
jgi:hypothetical protein